MKLTHVVYLYEEVSPVMCVSQEQLVTFQRARSDASGVHQGMPRGAASDYYVEPEGVNLHKYDYVKDVKTVRLLDNY